MRIGAFEHLDPHRWRVHNGGDQVIGERRVTDTAVAHLDLLHQRQPQPLGRTTLDLPGQLLRMDHLAHVLDRIQRDHLHQTQLHVHVHHRTVHAHPELGVGGALTQNRVQHLGGPVMVLARVLDHHTTLGRLTQQIGQRHQDTPGRRDQLPTAQGQIGPRKPLGHQPALPCQLHDLVAHRRTRELDRTTGHVGLPGGR